MLLLSHLASVALLCSAGAIAETLCNKRAEYCDRRYSDISFIGAHNSPFVGPLPQHNQDIEVKQQLDLGIRFLQGQTHVNDDGVLSMCHSSCILEDAGSLQSFLETVKGWMDKNTDEVVTLLITNGDRLDISEFDDAFSAAGIKDHIFVPPSSPKPLPIEEWPTLGEFIKSGKRLIVFIGTWFNIQSALFIFADYDTDMKKVPYLLDQFAYYFETPFSTTDPKFNQCKIDRPPGAKPDGRMYLVNHTLNVDIFGVLLPHRLAAPLTNAATGEGSIGAQVDLCHSLYDRNPNVVLVDFLTEGDVFKAERTMNGF